MSSIESLQQACIEAEAYLALNPFSRAAQGDLQRARSRLWAARNQQHTANRPEARRHAERMAERRAEADQRRAERDAREEERTQGRKAWLETLKARRAEAEANRKATEEKEAKNARARYGPKAGFGEEYEAGEASEAGEEAESREEADSTEESESESDSESKPKHKPKSKARTKPRFGDSRKYRHSQESKPSAEEVPSFGNGKFKEEFRSSFQDFESSKSDLYGSKNRPRKAQSDAGWWSRYESWNNASEIFFSNASAPFPRPPPYTCNKKRCIKAERLGNCHHGIEILLKGSGKYSKKWLKTERLRWHPDKFAKDKQEHISEAQEMFQMIQRLIDGGKNN
jgi:HD superfamily phosphohydrolase